jgi:hypothetical protein
VFGDLVLLAGEFAECLVVGFDDAVDFVLDFVAVHVLAP